MLTGATCSTHHWRCMQEFFLACQTGAIYSFFLENVITCSEVISNNRWLPRYSRCCQLEAIEADYRDFILIKPPRIQLRCSTPINGKNSTPANSELLKNRGPAIYWITLIWLTMVRVRLSQEQKEVIGLPGSIVLFKCKMRCREEDRTSTKTS